jgi:AAA domain
VRIDGWQVDGFGTLKDASEQGLGRGVTVLLGENEAGKSTLLAFIRAVLYGFPRANAKDERSYPPLSGGRHGGKLLLRDREDRLWVVGRYGDRRDAELTRPDGTVGDLEDLALLLGHTDRSLFKSVFAFGLEELQQFTTLTGEGVRDSIFSAGISGAGKSARETIDKLAAQQAALLKQGRGEAEINNLVKEIQRVDGEMAEARRLAGRYAEFERAAEEQEAVAEDLATQADERQRLKTEVEALVTLRPQWEELEGLRLELADLPNVADDGLRSSVSGAVTALAVQRDREERLEGLRADEATAAAELEDSLARLGDGWDMARADALDVSISASDEVRGRQHEVDAAEQSFTDARRRHEDAVQALQLAKASLDRVRGELPQEEPLTIEAIDRGESALTSLRGDVGQLQLMRASAEREAPSGGSGFGVIMILAAAAAVGAVAGFVLGYAQLGVGLLVAAVLAAVAGVVVRRPASPGGDESARPGAIAELEESIRTTAGALGLPGAPSSQDLAGLEARFRTQRTARADWASVQSRASDAQRIVEEKELLLGDARGKLAIAEADAARVAAEWAAWRSARGLGELTPEAVLLVIEEAGTAKRARKEREAAASELAAIEQAAAAWDESAAGYLRAAARSVEGLSREALRSALVKLDDDLTRREEVQGKAVGLERAISVGLAVSRDPEAAENELATGDPGIWEDQVLQLDDEVRRLRGERDAAMKEATEARMQMRAIAESADIARLQGELESHRARLLELTREYKVVSAARALVAETLRAYVRDRQPAVLEDGSTAFQAVTNGRYLRVEQDGEGALESIVVIDRDGVRKSPDQLSTGTQQQLYLSIRLALASMFAGRSEPLPIVMDDCLVNFDPARAASLAALLAERSSDGQALLFTCHPETAELMQAQTAGPVRVVELARS